MHEPQPLLGKASVFDAGEEVFVVVFEVLGFFFFVFCGFYVCLFLFAHGCSPFNQYLSLSITIGPRVGRGAGARLEKSL